jgi:hypothetical protein
MCPVQCVTYVSGPAQKSWTDFDETIEDPKGHVFVPFFVSLLAVVLQPRPFPHAAPSVDDDCDAPFLSRENTKDKTAAWAACFAGVIAWVYTSKVDRRVECRNSSCITLNSVPTLLSSVEYV